MTDRIKVTFASLTIWDDGTVHKRPNPYIHLKTGEGINSQFFPDEIVIPMKEIKIIFDFPLNFPVTIEFISEDDKGFTRKELAENIRATYIRLWKDDFNDIMNGRLGRYSFWDNIDMELVEIKQIDFNLFCLKVET
jgi:hypothetical protein